MSLLSASVTKSKQNCFLGSFCDLTFGVALIFIMNPLWEDSEKAVCSQTLEVQNVHRKLRERSL